MNIDAETPPSAYESAARLLDLSGTSPVIDTGSLSRVAEAGAQVTVDSNTVESTGAWRLDHRDHMLSDGSHEVKATQTALAGYRPSPPDTLAFTTDARKGISKSEPPIIGRQTHDICKTGTAALRIDQQANVI